MKDNEKCPEGGRHEWSEWSYATSPSGVRICWKCLKREFD
jgi:hypothetical protein